MTFLEAAIEILRRADGALHFSEIARQAVEEDLLSHVGRDPEAAMRSCLNSAVRSGSARGGYSVVRERPGYYRAQPAEGAEAPPPEGEGAPAGEPGDGHDEKKLDVGPTEKKEAAGAGRRGGRGKKGGRGGKPEQAPAREAAEAGGEEPSPAGDPPAEGAAVPDLQFEAPTGAGLEGVTDVALVMANALSRLVEERPDLKDDLEAMQQQAAAKEAAASEPPAPARASTRAGGSRRGGAGKGSAPVPTRVVRVGRGSKVEVQVAEKSSGSRRRRRRRRKGKRVDWSEVGATGTGEADVTEQILDGAAEILRGAGSRSLHVRQIAESLAERGVLGGEISELERAVTAAILTDVSRRGRMSRFVARGDARYQLHETRLPEAAGKAEETCRAAIVALDRSIEGHLAAWLCSLGVRALEALVRMYLQGEGYAMVATLPPGRGVGRLVVEDPEAEGEGGRTLVLVVPRKTTLDPRLWDGEIERNECAQLFVVAMGAQADDTAVPGDARLLTAAELAGWLRRAGIGVERTSVELTLLDPVLIESIAGLDT